MLLFLPLSLGFAVVTIARRERWERLALAVALPLTVLEIALTYRYNIWLGRFLITPVLLTMPLAAVLYRRRALAAAAALVGGVTLVAAHAYNTAKPTGLDCTLARLVALARLGTGADTPESRTPSLRSTLLLPEYARVGVTALDEWVYPLYGHELERRVIPLLTRSRWPPPSVSAFDCVVAGTPARGAVYRPGWRRLRFADSVWTLFDSASPAARGERRSP